MAFAEDLDVFLADFGVPCIAGAAQFMALLDQPDEVLDLQRVSVQSRQFELTYRTDAATLTRGQALTVDGTAYTVREAARQVGDGKFSRCILSRT
jgi:hypothetical protein